MVTQNLTIDSKARAIGYAAVVEGDVARVNRQIEDVRRVTVEDLQRVAQTYLVPEKSLVIRVPRNVLGSAMGKLRSALSAGQEAASEDDAATEGSDTAEDDAAVVSAAAETPRRRCRGLRISPANRRWQDCWKAIHDRSIVGISYPMG